MKNRVLRVFAVVLAIVMMLQASFAVTGGEQLLKYNMLQQSDNGLEEAEVLTRERLAKYICDIFGETENAERLNGVPKYADLDEMCDCAKPYIAYVTDKKWMSGVGNNKFDPKGTVSERQIGAVVLRALGYEYSWVEVSVKLFMHGIAPIKTDVTRGEAFDYLWRVVRQPIAKNGKSILVNLNKVTDEEFQNVEKSQTVKAARTFKLVNIAEGVDKLTDGSGKDYLLVGKDAKVPENYRNLMQIRVPVERAFVATTPVVSYLNALSPEFMKTIVGVTTKKEEWVYPEIVGGIESGAIAYVEKAYGTPLNAEAVLALKPNVVFIDGYNVDESAKLRESLEKFGVPVLHVTEYKEPYPNGLVEWIKFFGALYEKKDAANQYYVQSLAREKEIFAKAKDLKEEQKVSVAMGMSFSGTFYVAGKDAPVKDQIAKLGGNYVFGDIPGGSSITITPEEFVVKGKDADILIYTSLPQYLGGVEGLVAKFPQVKEFKAYKNNKIYILDIGYYMRKIDEVQKFEDILFILHPELMPNHTLKMYQHLDVTK